MEKIMFNDKYGFTDDVLNNKKTQLTKIIITRNKSKLTIEENPLRVNEYIYKSHNHTIRSFLPDYKIGDIIAIAQSLYCIKREEWRKNSVIIPVYDDSIIGFYDKGYGKAKDMPHQILITNVRVKKIQDISHEDCMLEGVKFCEDNQMYFVKGINEYELSDSTIWFHSPRDAFRSLINRINGDGTYENNPYAFIYNFKLIK